jgi:hypothetical protein
MRMELRRLTGELVGQLPWPGEATNADELRAKAKAALAGFYEGNGHLFWPRQRFASNALEEVRIVSEDGETVASYTINDMIEETNRTLVSRVDA